MGSSIDRRLFLAVLASSTPLTWRAHARSLPELVVTHDPNCGCCGAWVEHMRSAGFSVAVRQGPVTPLKAKLGVPRDLASCHTAQVGGYVVEGHVPAVAVRQLLEQKPDAMGLSVPGMPTGSPGMEVEGVEPDRYEVVLFGAGWRRPFGSYRGRNRF